MFALAVGLGRLAAFFSDPQPRNSQATGEPGQSPEPAAT
jgi:hypothetical protein